MVLETQQPARLADRAAASRSACSMNRLSIFLISFLREKSCHEPVGFW
jgi:hypothetical protein